MKKAIERELIKLIAMDRFDRIVSSLSGKLKRRKSKLAKSIDLKGKEYQGSRVWAREDKESNLRTRGMKEGIAKFCKKDKRRGRILMGYIEEQREVREDYFSFGMQEGCRMTFDDYMEVMMDMGFTFARAKRLYYPLIGSSRELSRKKQEKERSILINQGI